MPDTNPDDGKGPNIGGPQPGYTNTPSPDPTVLTTAALYREVAALKELIEQRIVALKDSHDIEFRDLREVVDRVSSARDRRDEEIQKRTDLQFTLVEQQRVEQKADTKNAVDAALTAQKEAIAKAEAGTTKQIDQLQLTFKTEIDSLRRSVDENKAQIGATELSLRAAIVETDRKASGVISEKVGATTDRSGLYAALAAIGAVIAIAIGIVGVIASRGGG